MNRSNRLSNTLSFEPLKPKINITFIRTPFLRSFLGLQGYQLISVHSLQPFLLVLSTLHYLIKEQGGNFFNYEK